MPKLNGKWYNVSRYRQLSKENASQRLYFLILLNLKFEVPPNVWGKAIAKAKADMKTESQTVEEKIRSSQARKGWETRRKTGKVFTPSAPASAS